MKNEMIILVLKFIVGIIFHSMNRSVHMVRVTSPCRPAMAA